MGCADEQLAGYLEAGLLCRIPGKRKWISRGQWRSAGINLNISGLLDDQGAHQRRAVLMVTPSGYYLSAFGGDAAMAFALIGSRKIVSMGVIAADCFLSGCQLLGPSAIDLGRDRYNDIIQATSVEQMMANIVRVNYHQPTLFMDVTEVDAAQSFGGTLLGAATNIGAKPGTSGSTIAGRVGGAQGSVSYAETPTIRYQPLLGQALVAQLVTPIDVNSLAQLLQSNWPVGSVLDFGASSLTLESSLFFPTLDLMMELGNNIRFVAASSELTKDGADHQGNPGQNHNEGATTIIQLSSAGASGSGKKAANDSLVVYQIPFGAPYPARVSDDFRKQVLTVQRRNLQLWVRLLRIYRGTQPPDHPEIVQTPDTCQKQEQGWLRKNGKEIDIDQSLAALDAELAKPDSAIEHVQSVANCLRQWIELRVEPVKFQATKNQTKATPGKKATQAEKVENDTQDVQYHAPLMQTRSAIGILKQAVERPYPDIEFMRRDVYEKAIGRPWNRNTDFLTYYTLLPQDEDSIDCCDTPPLSAEDAIAKRVVAEWLAKYGENCAASGSGCNLIDLSPQDDRQSIDGWMMEIEEAMPSPDTEAAKAKRAAWPSWLGAKLDNPTAGKWRQWIDGWHKTYCLTARCNDTPPDYLDDWNIRLNTWLAELRRYILIIVATERPPSGAYAAYQARDGKWYYIDGADAVSQRNFDLLVLYTTMMAVPPQTPPLTPTISVGGG